MGTRTVIRWLHGVHTIKRGSAVNCLDAIPWQPAEWDTDYAGYDPFKMEFLETVLLEMVKL